MTQRELEILAEQECFDLLAHVAVGRLIYTDEQGPAAVPVNFSLHGRDLLMRVHGGVKAAAVQQPVLGFEADQIDDDQRAGWSVLLRGVARVVPQSEVAELLSGHRGQFPRPWAEGVHNVWLNLVPTLVTGRRLGAERLPLAL
jgi:nitroimidazol reductase NimA-like FMN-containing flavoprotein (pyridoxamine 5'-phosphate oxidase superfamily)